MIRWLYYIQLLYAMGIGKMRCLNRNHKKDLKNGKHFPRVKDFTKRDANFELVAAIWPLLLVNC
jgi:hypothetical protein